MKPLKQRVTTVTLTPPGEPIFSERGYTVSIDDESGGEFIVVRENDAALAGGIRIDPEDWPAVRDAIDGMVSQIASWADGSAPE